MIYLSSYKNLGLILILLLAATLRLIGLKWGIPTAEILHSPFHPDEGGLGMAALSQINLEQCDFNPETSHIEGSLTSYIWTFVAFMLQMIGILQKMPCCFGGITEDYGTVMYASRVVVVLFDLLAVLFTFLLLKKLKNENTALLGALILAIAPFEIIYSHYMRSHIVINFFVVIVTYYSLYIYDHKGEQLRLYALLGFLAGLATAARYVAGIVVMIPVLMLFYKQLLINPNKLKIRTILLTLFSRISVLGIFVIVGLFVGDPPLFLSFDSIKPVLSITVDTTAKNEFYLSNLLDLSRLWVYIRDLIPYGTLPGLWIIFYFSVIYLLFRKKYYRYTIPLILFIPIYLYPMAKGYSMPIFIRAALIVFPIFAILSAIAITDLMQLIKTKVRPHYAGVISAMVCAIISFILLSTLAYDFAYVKGMNHDPRIALYHYLKDEPKSELRIGIYPNGHEYFVIAPTLNVLPNKKVTFIAESPQGASVPTIPGTFSNNPTIVDYVLISAYTKIWSPDHFEFARQKIAELTAKHYTLVKVFETPLSLGPITFSHENNPSSDLQYPFPVLYLLKPRS
ncbi:MAG: hypothetical protein BWK78_08425 [Thiotrichaceae bacterium IS1]|nr:MAG: hypothetical protein BWK78_08425 [Thiotrichaceae bacterium IS1]